MPIYEQTPAVSCEQRMGFILHKTKLERRCIQTQMHGKSDQQPQQHVESSQEY